MYTAALHAVMGLNDMLTEVPHDMHSCSTTATRLECYVSQERLCLCKVTVGKGDFSKQLFDVSALKGGGRGCELVI